MYRFIDRNCGHWIQCLNESSLGIDDISQDHNYTITIFKPSSVEALCLPIHPYSINLQLTITCSAETLAPTGSPTAAPPSATASPTSTPTFTSRVYCGYGFGGNRWCYHVDMFPVIGTQTSYIAAIASEEQNYAATFDVKFTANDNDCVDPSISLIFEEIDYNTEWEYLTVSDNDGAFIEKCIGDKDGHCGEWKYCLTNTSLGINKIEKNTNYTFQIYKPDTVNALCTDHHYSANLLLTIVCSADPTIYQTLGPGQSNIWLLGSKTLPRSDGDQAIGYDVISDTIYIIGGCDYNQSVVKFDPEQSAFSEVGVEYLTRPIHDNFQFYTQVSNDLYIIDNSQQYIHRMVIPVFEINYDYISIPELFHVSRGCMTSMVLQHEYLMIIGGTQIIKEWDNNQRQYIDVYQYLDSTLLFDITTDVWTTIEPLLNTARGRSGCGIVDQRAYIIGGLNNQGYLPSIEVLDISNMDNLVDYSWKYLESLPVTVIRPGIITVGTNILIIGGEAGIAILQVIDTVTNGVYSPGSIQYAAGGSASILVYPNVYSFGGVDTADEYIKKYQYHRIEFSLCNNTFLSVYGELSCK